MMGSRLRAILLSAGYRELRPEDLGYFVPTWTDPWTGVSEPDFATPGFERFVRGAKPDVVLNAAGIVGSHKCFEIGDEVAMRSNASGPARLAEAVVDVGSFFVHFASDVEFDPDAYGLENGGINPETSKLGARTLYGWSKHLGRTKVESIVPFDRLAIVYPSFGFGGCGDSQSVLSAIMRTAAGVPGYDPSTYAQLDPGKVKELTWHDDVGHHVLGILEDGAVGRFSSTSCDLRPYGEYVELIFDLPGARRFEVNWKPELDYKGDSFFDPEFARRSWARVGLVPTSLEEALAREWDRLLRTDPSELLPHSFEGHFPSLAAAKVGAIHFDRTRW